MGHCHLEKCNASIGEQCSLKYKPEKVFLIFEFFCCPFLGTNIQVSISQRTIQDPCCWLPQIHTQMNLTDATLTLAAIANPTTTITNNSDVFKGKLELG